MCLIKWTHRSNIWWTTRSTREGGVHWRRSMNATPTWPSNKFQRHGAQTDLIHNVHIPVYKHIRTCWILKFNSWYNFQTSAMCSCGCYRRTFSVTLRASCLFTKSATIQHIKYDKQDQQEKAAFNERNPHMTKQQEPMARSPGGPQTYKGQGKDTLIIKW
jgi:hypothetical protein